MVATTRPQLIAGLHLGYDKGLTATDRSLLYGMFTNKSCGLQTSCWRAWFAVCVTLDALDLRARNC